MKRRYIILCLLFFGLTSLSAQDIFDISRYANNDINGTARYMSMAGAFGALGGDMSSIQDNPAGLGIYRNCDVALTLDLAVNQNNADWNSVNTSSTKCNFAVNNAGLVWAFCNKEKESGWIANNIAFTFARLKKFNRTLDIRDGASLNSMTDFMADFTEGFDEATLQYIDNDSVSYDPYNNTNVPYLSELAYQSYLINPDTDNVGKWYSLLQPGENSTAHYKAVETGHIDEVNFAYGANVSNVFYWGVSFNLLILDYSKTSIYNETFGEGGGFTLKNVNHTSGAGFNFKIGAIARPCSFLRLGVSFQTPSFYTLTDRTSATLDYDVFSVGQNKAPVAVTNYRLNGPLRVQASAAFVIGKSAIISADYVFTNTRKMVLKEDNYDLVTKSGYDDVMSDIDDMALNNHMVKLGAEVRIGDKFAVRAGGAYRTPTLVSDAVKNVPLNTTRCDMEYINQRDMWYGSAGFGYRGFSGFGVDVAYSFRLQNEQFRSYCTSPTAATIKSMSHNVVATLSWRF